MNNEVKQSCNCEVAAAHYKGRYCVICARSFRCKILATWLEFSLSFTYLFDRVKRKTRSIAINRYLYVCPTIT